MTWVESPTKGTPGVEITFRLLEGPDKDATIRWVGWLSDNTVARCRAGRSQARGKGTAGAIRT
jgi:hypothetical protein